MKEFNFKRVISPREAEFSRTTRVKALTEATVRRVIKDADNNYYENVSDKYKPFIDDMVVANAASIDEMIGQELPEEIARGWLIRQSLLPRLLQSEGFRDVQTLPYEIQQGEFNQSTIACITGKGTLLMVGKGGLVTPERTGTEIVWEPLLERRNEERHVPNLKKGASVVGKPEVGKPLGIRYRHEENNALGEVQQEEAASLVTIFTRPGEVPLAKFEDTLKVSNEQINRTLRRK